MGPEPPQMQEVCAEYDAMRWRKYRLVTERAKDDPLKLARLALHELSETDYFAKNSADYVRRVLEIQRNIDQQVAAINAQKYVVNGRRLSKGDDIRNRNADKLADMLMWVRENPSFHHPSHPQWSDDELIPLWVCTDETGRAKDRGPGMPRVGCRR